MKNKKRKILIQIIMLVILVISLIPNQAKAEVTTPTDQEIGGGRIAIIHC